MTKKRHISENDSAKNEPKCPNKTSPKIRKIFFVSKDGPAPAPASFRTENYVPSGIQTRMVGNKSKNADH